MFPVTIEYPKYIDTCAMLIGRMRDAANAEMNEAAPRFKRGEHSGFVDILGIRGELIAQHIAFACGYKYIAAPLLSIRPEKMPDLVISDAKIDVKAIREDAPDLLVNAEAHRKQRGIVTHYQFVQCFANCIARYWIHSFAEVDQWPVKNCKYSDAHYLAITPNA